MGGGSKYELFHTRRKENKNLLMFAKRNREDKSEIKGESYL